MAKLQDPTLNSCADVAKAGGCGQAASFCGCACECEARSKDLNFLSIICSIYKIKVAVSGTLSIATTKSFINQFINQLR